MFFESLLENSLKIKNKKEPEVEGIKFIAGINDDGADPVMNSYVVINGQNYRVRGEVLVFNSKDQILCFKKDKLTQYNTYYALPGGSAEQGIDLKDQVKEECEEETHKIIKNIKYTGIYYTQAYNGNYPQWHKTTLWPLGFKYEGIVCFVYIAEYSKEYTGKHKGTKQDLANFKNFKFYNIDEIDFRKEHLKAIDYYRNI